MHFIYERANGNGLLARKYPSGTAPSYKIFARFTQRLKDTGSLEISSLDQGLNRTGPTAEVDERNLTGVEQDPETLLRRIAAQENLSIILEDTLLLLATQLLYLYHIQRI